MPRHFRIEPKAKSQAARVRAAWLQFCCLRPKVLAAAVSAVLAAVCEEIGGFVKVCAFSGDLTRSR